MLDVEKKIYDYYDKMKIVWNSQYMSDKTGNIYYSINNGQDWKYIKSIKVSKGYFSWDIPDFEFVSKNCLIICSNSIVTEYFFDKVISIILDKSLSVNIIL